MNTDNKYKILENRLLDFSVAVIKELEQQKLHDAIKNQLLRSATSIGANYYEANNASSKQDFRNKIYISKKEAAETEYWLKVIQKLRGSSENLELLLKESHEIVLILQKIVTTLDKGSGS